MKKLLLSSVILFVGFITQSQVILSVEQPTSIAAIYSSNNIEITFAKASDGWGGPDLTLQSSSVSGEVKLAKDLSGTADSLMCVAATAGSLSGKIALLYRGICDFGQKAKMAQDAGAIGVIIVNNVLGTPIEMNPASEGMNVTIPVIMITNTTGAILKQKLENSEIVQVYIGTAQNYFTTDLGASISDIITAPSQAIPLDLVRTPTVFPINLGIRVYNYGSTEAMQSRVNVKINFNGTLIYSANSSYFTIPSGSNLLVNSFPSFTPAVYNIGEYTMVYTVESQNTDQNPNNNIVSTKFNVTSDLFTPAKLNSAGMPTANSYYYATSTQGSFESCVSFKNPDASNVAIEGMYFNVAGQIGSDLTGEVLNIKAYQWDDQFTNILDPYYSLSSINLIASSPYIFPSDLQQTTIYQAFTTPISILDNQRYLFCIMTSDPTLMIGYDTQTNHSLDPNPQPLNPLNVDGSWYTGFGIDMVPAIGVKTFTCPTAALPAPTVINDSSCTGGTLVLNASGEIGAELYWFTSPYAPFYYYGTGNTFTTPALTQTTSYWVAQMVVGCNSSISPLTEVLAVIKPNTSSTLTETVCGTSYSFFGNTFFSSGTYAVTIPNSVGCDSLVTLNLNFVSAYSTNNPQAICQGDSYVINNNTYTTAGTYVDVFQSVVGCDSVVTTVLTVNPNYSVTNPQAICQGSAYFINGNAYSTPGTYTDVLLSSKGCDSTVTTILTVNPIYSVNNPQTICQGGSYSVGSNTYLTGGTYVDVLQTISGCDSTITTILTVNPVYTISNPQTICEGGSYSIGGNTYSIAGTYTDVLQNTLGCDSTVTTTLTVNPSYTINNPQVICEGGSYIIGNSTYTTGGTYTDVFQTSLGCDSSIVTVLTVNPSYTNSNPQSICQGDSYVIGTNTYTAAGTYTDVFQTAAGCDSTITTILTIISTQLNLTVTQVDSTLTVGQTNAIYQWIDCANGNALIPGATEQTFSSSLGGSFAVIVTKCGVSDTSECKYLSGLGVNEKSLNFEVNLYPNPASEMISISVIDANLENLIIRDLNGKQLLHQAAFGQSTEVKVDNLSSGVYLLEIQCEKGSVVKRFVKN